MLFEISCCGYRVIVLADDMNIETARYIMRKDMHLIRAYIFPTRFVRIG